MKHIYSGKVRDIYDAGDDLLFMVASDRISAFDVVMQEPIADKGRVLTAMTSYWLDFLSELAPNHLVGIDPADYPAGWEALGEDIAGRAMLVRKAQMLPIECIVRGYVSGSAWKEYSKFGTINKAPIEPGIEESGALPEPIFTPSTKADTGHDENITYDEAVELVGSDVAFAAAELCIEAYKRAAHSAKERGIIIADTKFELGFIDGSLSICDEVLTPDSSRFWLLEEFKPGGTPPSFDKQPVRDWLESIVWDKSPPPPRLPDEVVTATSDRYREAYRLISGLSLDDWYGVKR
ncbi:MAG TPA: phosphoribosylaminoimidazolesuccinocarboxamide synthase [Acidimicrobiales bacterium]|nr:phosphoribosylaminoimidazolesuccinocarboxamide synthase [Acidimicrobiales bacterium]